MRTGRLFGVILTMLITGLLLAPTAGAQPPFRLPGYVTDDAGALSVSGRTDVGAAIEAQVDDSNNPVTNSGRWKSNGMANYYVEDGIHPKGHGHALMAVPLTLAAVG